MIDFLSVAIFAACASMVFVGIAFYALLNQRAHQRAVGAAQRKQREELRTLYAKLPLWSIPVTPSQIADFCVAMMITPLELQEWLEKFFFLTQDVCWGPAPVLPREVYGIWASRSAAQRKQAEAVQARKGARRQKKGVTA